MQITSAITYFTPLRRVGVVEYHERCGSPLCDNAGRLKDPWMVIIQSVATRVQHGYRGNSILALDGNNQYPGPCVPDGDVSRCDELYSTLVKCERLTFNMSKS